MAGYKDGTGMLNNADDLLASTVAREVIPVMIFASTADAGNVEDVNVLRKGIVLTKFASGADAGKYSNHDSGNGVGLADEANAVVLAQDIDMGDQSKDVLASAYFAATFHTDKLIVDDEGNFDWTLVPRLQRR